MNSGEESLFANSLTPLESSAEALAYGLRSEESEQVLLGAVLIGGPRGSAAYGSAASRVTAPDFALRAHGAIWEQMGRQVDAGRPADVISLIPHLADLESELQALGGVAGYLSELVAAMCSPPDIGALSDTIRGLARRRDAIRQAVAMAQSAADLDLSLDEVISGAVCDAETLLVGGRARTRREVLERVVKAMENPPPCYSTGLPTLDYAMGGGLYAGRVYGIAGLGKAGKSMLAGTISGNLNASNIRHAYVALEMGSSEIEHRAIARDLGIHSHSMLGNVSTETLMKVSRYALNAADSMIYIDVPGATFEELRGEILAARHRHKVTGIIVDYWQLVTGRAKGSSEEEHLRVVAQWLASAAKRLNIWVLVLAQLADDGEATAISRTGLNRASDQLYFLRRKPDTEWAWLEQRFTRYTPPGDVGTEDVPALRIRPGPCFEDCNQGYGQ